MPHHAVSEHTRYVLDRNRWEAELERSGQRRQQERERPQTQAQPVVQAEDFWAEVDKRIEQKYDFIFDTVGQALAQLLDKERESIQSALDKRDREIKSLRREIKLLRDEVGLERGLANLKAEVDQARQQARNHEFESLQRELGTLRNEVELKLNLKSELAAARVELNAAHAEVEELRQQAPSFKTELEDLRAQITKQEKTISRLRTEQSILGYQQKQLDVEQQKNRKEVSLTAVKVTAFGEQTREVLERLRDSGFDLVGEMESPSEPRSSNGRV